MLVAPFQSTPTSRRPTSDQHLETAAESAPFVTPARLLNFDGVDESPSDQHPNNLHTSYCPLCMQYFEGVYETTCCSQNICGSCGTGLVREGAKKAAPLQAMLSFVPVTASTLSAASSTAIARRLQERDEERAMRQQLLLSALNMNLVLDTPYFKEECVLNIGARLARPTSGISGSSASDADSRSSSQAGNRRPSVDGSSKFSNFSINVSKVATLVSVVCPYCFRFLKVRPCEKKVCAPQPPPAKLQDATPLKRTTTVEGFQSHSPQLGGIHSSSPLRADDESSDPTSLMSPSPSGQLGGGRVGGRRATGPYSSLYSSNSPGFSSPRVDLNHSPLGRLRPLDGSLPLSQSSSSPYPLSVRGGVYGRSGASSSSMPAGPASRYVRQARLAASPQSPSVNSDEDFSIGDSSSLRTNPAAAALAMGHAPPIFTPSPEATEPAGGAGPSTPLAVNAGHQRRSVMGAAPSTPSPRGQLRSHARVPRLSTLVPEISLSDPMQRVAQEGRRVPPTTTTHKHARSHNDTLDAIRPDMFEADTFVGPQTARGHLRAPPPLPPAVSSPRRQTDVTSPYLLRRLPARSADTTLPPVNNTPGRSNLPVAATGPSPVRAGDDFGEMQRKLMLQLTTNATYRAQFTVDFEGLQAVERNMPRTPARSLPPITAARPPAPPTRVSSGLPPIASTQSTTSNAPHRQVGGRRRGSSTAHVTAPVIASSSRQGSARSASQPTAAAQRKVQADAAAEDRWCPVM